MSTTFRDRAVAGGIVLVIRQFVGMALSFCGMLVSTRILGPAAYGQFMIASSLVTFIAALGKMGLDVYFVRMADEPDDREVGVAQGLLSLTSLAGATVLVLAGIFGDYWYNDVKLRSLVAVQALILPPMLLSSVPLSFLDRELRYRDVATAELGGQLVFLAVAVPATLATGSAWALVVGTFAQWWLVYFAASRLGKIQYSPQFDMECIRCQLRYGVGYSSAMWLWQVRDLVNPVIVGRYLGTSAVAYIAMAIRLATMIAFAKTAAWRVYMSYLARVSGDRESMRQAVQAGLNHQVFILAAVFLPFMAVAPEAVRLVLGEKWQPVLAVFPFVAVGIMINAGFSLHTSSLCIFGHNRDVAVFHIAYVVLFCMASVVLIFLLRSPVAYGIAELVAVPSYLLLRRALRKRLFVVNENFLYMNVLSCSTGIFLLWGLEGESLYARIPVALVVSAILCAVAPNRLTAGYWWRKIRNSPSGVEGA